ncbi:lysophospholipid acyltransferase family protein [Inediibacterium massiliense]|uniref:lysophospholipid acyltransferase family protein n=1 Tax=Inediibacterium massiliense TaxID=1658111 RepID=UPI0006B60FD2|nr:lysophospholipid acyltransferase family protein [Inediibacterium massiliense]
MFKTIYVGIYIVLYMLVLFPKLWKINNLEKEGKIEEMNHLLHKIASKWGKATVNITGSEILVSGLENIPEGPVLFVGNHQGYFDIPILYSSIPKPISFVAKIELGNIPVFGAWMRKQRCIFIDRENPRQSLKAIQEGIKSLKGGHSMVIFPEGTRSKSSQMNEFKKGSLKMATKAKVPIVPITIDGSYKILEENKNRIKASQVKLTISKPIYTENLSKEEENELSEKIYKIIQSNLN